MGKRIPVEDLPLITELLQTLSLSEVAEKWGVRYDSLGNFLTRNNTSFRKIIADYRKPIIVKALLSREPGKITAKTLGVSVQHFYEIRKELLG